MGAYTGGSYILCEHVGITCFSTHLLWDRTCIQGKQSPIKPSPQGFYSDTLGSDPTPDQALTTTEKRGSPGSYPAQCLDLLMQTIPDIKGIQPAHPEERCGWCPYQNQPLYQRHWTHTVSIGMLPHKNTTLRPQQKKVSPKFIETQKAK